MLRKIIEKSKGTKDYGCKWGKLLCHILLQFSFSLILYDICPPFSFLLVTIQHDTNWEALTLLEVHIVSHFSATFSILRAHLPLRGSIENTVSHLKLSFEMGRTFSFFIWETQVQTCPIQNEDVNPVFPMCSKFQHIHQNPNTSHRSSVTCHKILKQWGLPITILENNILDFLHLVKPN